MTFEQITAIMILLGLVSWAMVEDLRSRRIPNWLTLTIAAIGLAHSLAPLGPIAFSQAMAGLLVGLAIPFVLYAVGALGAGDAKLLGGIGAWVGAGPILWLMALTALIGGVLILAQALWQRRCGEVIRNCAALVLSLIQSRRLGITHFQQTGQSCRSLEKTVPYAVPIWMATVIVLLTPVVALAAGR